MAEVSNQGDAAATKEAAKEETVGIDASGEVQNNGDAVKAEETKPAENNAEQRAKIIRQMEYYFGDINLARDRFLKEIIAQDNGWVSSDTMLKFNRLKIICSDWDTIAQAVRLESDLIEVSEDGKKVRRLPSKPLPGDSKERRDEIASRTVYCKSFPLDSTLDDLMPFFEGYGKVETVFMKRDFHKHTFKGSVFVTYKTKGDAEKFLTEEGSAYKDAPLEVKLWKTDYFKQKMGERKGGNKKKEENKTEQTKEDKDDAEENDNKKGAKPEVDPEDEEKVKQEMTKGAVLHISCMSQETKREEVRELFSKHGDVSWVDFDQGVTEGYIRLKEPNSAESALESLKKSEKGMKLHGVEVHVRVVDGDEEVQYWQKMYRDIADRKQKKRDDQRRKNRRDGGRGRGRGRGRGGYQGKRRNDERGGGGASAAKSQKLDA